MYTYRIYQIFSNIAVIDKSRPHIKHETDRRLKIPSKGYSYCYH